MKQKKIYISGPMSNLTREQYMEIFTRAEQSLRRHGYNSVVNPIRVWACRWLWLWKILVSLTSEHTAYTLVLLYDLWLLSRCDLIYKMAGWKDSRGANIESCVAYWFKIWPVHQNDIRKLDKRLEKLQEKWKKNYAIRGEDIKVTLN